MLNEIDLLRLKAEVKEMDKKAQARLAEEKVRLRFAL